MSQEQRSGARPMADGVIYHPAYVRDLFDRMAATYGMANLISSFGFARRWRRQCVGQIRLEPGMRVADWMSGMGEAWYLIRRGIGPEGTIEALDISPVMCARARQQASYRQGNITLAERDVLENGIPPDSYDALIATFGIKTFSPAQQAALAREIARVLRPGAPFSLIEVSLPRTRWFRFIYHFYIGVVIPIIGALLLGNPEHYRMLGRYTAAFGDCTGFARQLAAAGLEVEMRSHFFGCATSVHGRRPAGS